MGEKSLNKIGLIAFLTKMETELTMNPIPSKMNLGAKIFQTMRCRRRRAAESIEANNRMPFLKDEIDNVT